MVQDMFMRGEYADIHGYCFCDVIDTYFVFDFCEIESTFPKEEGFLPARQTAI